MNKSRFQIRLFDARPLSWWKSKKNEVDMNPPYQRKGRIWSIADKAYLIDSIINGYDVPKVYIADFSWGDSSLNQKKLPYAIIDGKQRLEAILDFFEGQIVLQDDFVYFKNPKLSLGGLGYRDLVNNFPDIAEDFENYNLTVMSVYAESDKPIHELFLRLNRSKPLTGAEVRNAMMGPVPKIIRELVKHEFFHEIIKFKVSRGEDLNAAAKILMMEHHNSVKQTTKKNDLDQFVSSAKREKERVELAARQVREVLDDMATVFLPKDVLLGSAGIFPVYYWLIRELSIKELSEIRSFLVHFEKLRQNNREKVRANASSEEIDQELVDFDNYNRSTNDAASHEGRYKILIKRFRSKS